MFTFFEKNLYLKRPPLNQLFVFTIEKIIQFQILALKIPLYIAAANDSAFFCHLQQFVYFSLFDIH